MFDINSQVVNTANKLSTELEAILFPALLRRPSPSPPTYPHPIPTASQIESQITPSRPNSNMG